MENKSSELAFKGIKRALEIGEKLEEMIAYIDEQRKNAEEEIMIPGQITAYKVVFKDQVGRYVELTNLKNLLNELMNSDRNAECLVNDLLYRLH